MTLTAFFVQLCLAMSGGVHWAALMLRARYAHKAQPGDTRLVVQLAATLLLCLSLFIGALLQFIGQQIASIFSSDERVVQALLDLGVYVAPVLLFKSVSGLVGQFLAARGHGKIGTLLLLVFPWGVGLVGAFYVARLVQQGSGGDSRLAALALLQTQTAAWFAAAFCFCLVCSWNIMIRDRLALPTVHAVPNTHVHSGRDKTSNRVGATSAKHPLDEPLLDSSTTAL
eukprot:CAMPEP_0183383004 /NCGR_PEP_ID=MMETSP0164_2-20130417/127232_1 /TAXON_ID=221442 /ORGANISM="Coccolithus pelagicus ssp braarudi, Strain PLY182g" /LENGTH=226 /DNA_ID=CAMNT_0025560633 /DNA_START=744 /DNA_END=1424 /DNA_ORIENTATION=+